MRLMIILTLVFLFFSTATFSAEPGLSDREAKAFIEKLWSTSSAAIKLGDVDILGGLPGLGNKPDVPKGIINENIYKFYQAFEKQGIIKITKVKEYAKGDWNDYLAATAGGLKERVLIVKTDAGETLAKKGGLPQKDGWLYIKDGIFRVHEIVKNEPRQKGVDNYRIIMATYTVEWTPEYKSAMEMVGRKLSEKRKVIMLIKFDPFSSTWKFVTNDLANKDEDFSTKNVDTALLRTLGQ